MITTTLNKIAALVPDEADILLSKTAFTLTAKQLSFSFKCLLQYFEIDKPDDTPVDLETILHVTNLEYALWCLQTCEGIDLRARKFAVYCARQVQFMVTDKNLTKSVDIAYDYTSGKVSLFKLKYNHTCRSKIIAKGLPLCLNDPNIVSAMRSCHSTLIPNAAKAALHASAYAFYADYRKACAYDHFMKFKKLFC